MLNEVIVTKEVSADPDTVWAILEKGSGVHEWFDGVITSCRLEGEGEGSSRFCTMMNGADLEERILTIDSDNRVFRYAIDKHPLPAKNVVATTKVNATTEGAKIEWSAQFNVDSEEEAAVTKQTLEGLYTQGIDSLAKAASA